MPGKGVLRFLHLSDIHFRKDQSLSDAGLDLDIREQLEKDASEIFKEIGPVTGILVTGDIAFSGDVHEYAIAEKWLEQLTERLSGNPGQVWVIPGNHDVDRHALKERPSIRYMHQALRNTSTPGDLLAEFLQTGDRDQLLRPLANYTAFASKYNCAPELPRLRWEQDLPLNDGSILRLNGLNSAVISSELDAVGSSGLLLSPIQSIFADQPGVAHMVLCHHPTDWLIDGDEVETSVTRRAKIALCGHKHKLKIRQVDQTLQLVAGAVHPNRREPEWEPRYNIIEVEVVESDGRKLRVTVWARTFSKSMLQFVRATEVQDTGSKTYNLELPTWIPPSPAEQVTCEDDSDRAPNTLNATNDRILSKLNARRALLYRFLQLPLHKMYAVAGTLGIIEDADPETTLAELKELYFFRAENANLMKELWDEVAKVNPGSLGENPYGAEKDVD